MIGLFDQPLVCVDIETDGMNYARGHVLEIAVIRIENGEIIDEFSTLLNPGITVPHFIANLTGITTNDLQGQPAFDDVAERLLEIMEGALFVAHNVRFDYSFIKEEFRRIGIGFSPKMLCTVKLSRALYPEERSHKLSSLIERHDFSYSARHRAYDDAHVLWQFLHHVDHLFEPSTVSQAIARQLALPSLPRHIPEAVVKNLPHKSGIYIFEDENGAPLYIGKSIDIKKRVMSHFTRDSAEYREFKISQTVRGISHQVTSGELSALLLESKLIKEKMPLYNRRLRRQKRFIVAALKQNDNGYSELEFRSLDDIEESALSIVMGVYENRTKAKAAVLKAVRTFDLCPKLCGIEKATSSCFSYQLGRCHGACIGKENVNAYNQRLLIGFEGTAINDWPYDSAVTVSESKSHTEGLVVDKWRITGRFLQTDAGIKVEQYEAVFDLDAYKILRAFVLRVDTPLTIRSFRA